MLSFSEIPIKSGNKKPEYSFNREIESQLKGFKTYLKELGNGESTIRQKSNYTGYFLNWLESERLQPQETRYNDLLNFIDYCKLESNSKKQINSKLRSIRNFYEYLKKQSRKLSGPDIINPATNLHLRGSRHKIITGVIGFKELENLYQSFETCDNRSKRNKIILGLLIYQAITTEELHQLEPSFVKLKEGKIWIPGNRRRNGRILELKPFQVMELHQYIAETRPAILNEITETRPARKPDKINKTNLENQLFISINGSEHIKNSLLHLFRDVQKITPSIVNAKQIRQSVITYWLKTHNLRQVQYMAGHKYISSTERYQMNSLYTLQSRLDRFHPLAPKE
jgi:integrase/recombinase XerD